MEIESEVVKPIIGEVNSKFPLITLKVLPVLKERQQQHGLRHGDYQRYHGYCSRRLRRLRQTLRVPQGDRRHFKKKDVTLLEIDSEKGDSRYLEIPLTLTERAWSYAMALKQDSNTEPRKKFHSVCRLQKARDHSQILFNLTSESIRVDARTKLECEAYHALITATFFFELQNWSEAVDHFKKAQSIYTQISGALGEHPDASIYTEKITELMPSMRFCAYQTGDKLDISQLSAEFKSAAIQALIAQRPKMSEITFRNNKISIPDEKIAGLLARIEDLEQQEEKKVEMYEEILVEVRDAIQTVRDVMAAEKEQQGVKAKPSLLLNYLLYLRLRLTNARTELMIEEKTVPRDCIRLLELILHNYQEMLTIPGLDTDEEFQSEIDHLNYIFKARRCHYLAKAYMANKNWEGAFALHGRSLEYAQKGGKGLPADSVHQKTVQKIKESAEQSQLECRARAVIGNSKELVTETTKQDTPLAQRLDTFVLDESLTTKESNIISFPCEFEPVPTKPLFFDLAGHSIKFPEDKIHERAHSGSSPRKSGGAKGDNAAGLSGFVKGLWGWGK